MTEKIWAFATLTLLLACGRTTSNGERKSDADSSIQTTETGKKLTKEEKNKIDSLRLDTTIKNAFKIAQAGLKAEYFTKRYELQPEDSSYPMSVEILIGKLFKDNQKYFLLRRTTPGSTYLNLYKVTGDSTEKLIEREEGAITYIRDIITDVNGDGHKDYLVHWYPASGCCRRDVYAVYLNLPGQGKFTKDYEFINPTFSSREKIVRGVEYGRPGEVGLYKYRWNGLKVDTIEFIYPDALVKGQFIKTKKEAYRPTEKEGIVLKAVPQEYHNIESYEWFADF